MLWICTCNQRVHAHTRSIISLSILDILVVGSLDFYFFLLHRICNLLGFLHLTLAQADLFSHYRLLFNRDLLLHYRYVDRLFITNRSIRCLIGGGMTFNHYFLMRCWYIKVFLLRNYLFVQANLTCLHWLFAGTQL